MSDTPAPSTGNAAGTNVSYEGAEVAAAYRDVAGEWATLDAGAALVDTAWRRFFPVTGDERREFLHGQTTAHVTSLAAGDGAAALALTAQGRPLAIFALYESGERLWISTTVAHAAATRAALSRYLVADDCDFEDDIDAACVTVAGPGAAAVLAAAGAENASTLAPWGVASAQIAGVPVMIFARGDLRVASFDVLACDADGNASEAGAVRRALEAAGAAPCGVAALEIVRVESGVARYGVDVDENRLAIEARLEWAIHFAKGCYVGQEVVERAVSRGRINHELGLLSVSGKVSRGARVESGGDNDVVTSVVDSPRLGPIALAYLPRAKFETGSTLTLVSGAASTQATVASWPRPRILTGRTAR